MEEVDIDRRLARIESRIVQLMIWCGVPRDKEGRFEADDRKGGIFKALRQYDRDTAYGAARPEDCQKDKGS